MGIFYNPSKIIKIVPFILIVDGISKQHKMMPQKVFYQSLKGLGGFYGILCVHSIRNFDEFWSIPIMNHYRGS